MNRLLENILSEVSDVVISYRICFVGAPKTFQELVDGGHIVTILDASFSAIPTVRCAGDPKQCLEIQTISGLQDVIVLQKSYAEQLDLVKTACGLVKPGGHVIVESTEPIDSHWEHLAGTWNMEYCTVNDNNIIHLYRPFQNHFKKGKIYPVVRHKIEKHSPFHGDHYKSLVHIHKVLSKYNIPYVAVSGTNVGLARHGGIIPWDNDIDIGIMQEDLDRLLTFGSKLLSEDNIKIHHNQKNKHIHLNKTDIFGMIVKGPNLVSSAYNHILGPVSMSSAAIQKFGKVYIRAPIELYKALTPFYGTNVLTTMVYHMNWHDNDQSIPQMTLEAEDRSFVC